MTKPDWNLKAAPLPAVLGLSLVLALAAELVLLQGEGSRWLGCGLYVVAAVLFVLAVRRVETARPQFDLGAYAFRSGRPRLTLWITAMVLTALTVQGVLTVEKTPELGRALVVLWLAAIAVYVFSVLSASGWAVHFDGRAWWQAHWRVVLIAALLGAVAFSLRVYDLELHPYAFINDEGEVGKEAQQILNGQVTNFFDVGWASQPVWSFVPAAIFIKLLGHTAFAVRLVSVVQGAVTVSLLYLLGRDLYDSTAGILAAGVLLALPLHIHFSRLGVNNVGDAFFSTLTIWLTFRAVRRGTPLAYLLAGLAVGSAFYTYLGSRLAIALVFGSLVYMALRRPAFVRLHARQLLIFGGAVLVVALPMAVYFIKTPDQFFARLNSEGILSNGLLQRQAVQTGQGPLGVLLDQFAKSTFVYVSAPALAQFYNSPQPYLTALAAVFFVLGLAYTIWRLGDPPFMTLFAWFWAVVIFGSTLTIGPPSSQRLLMSAPPLALMVALGLQKSANVLVSARLITARIGLAVCGLLVAVFAVQGISFYFGTYRTGHYFEDPSNDFSYEVSVKADSLGTGFRTFLIGSPTDYAGFGDFGYLASDVQVVDYDTVTTDSFAALPRDKGAFFVAVPSRLADLRQVQQWLPGGTWQEVPRRYQAPQVDYYAYLVPPQVFAKP
jgi:hypothetical protein